MDYAAAHAPARDLVTTVIPLSDDAWVDVWQPTGGAWSSAREYAQYLLLELAEFAVAHAERVGDLAQAGLFYRNTIGFDPTRERQGAADLGDRRVAD